MITTPSPTDGTRPSLPPRRAINLCAAGLVGTLAIAPTIFATDILYLLVGDDWLNIFMPHGLPVGPFIIAILFVLFSVTYVRKVYVYKNIPWIKRFRRVAHLSSFLTLSLQLWNVWQLTHAPNQAVFAFYLIAIILLSLALALAALLLWTIHHNDWYDPNPVTCEKISPEPTPLRWASRCRHNDQSAAQHD
jgi:hypothetical protein